MIDLTLIHSFLTIAESGAITPAAARLFITQPALSRRLQQLEADLGVTLFERSARGVELTEEGRFIQREGKDLVERYDHMATGAQALNNLEVGSVRIGGGATAVSFLLPRAIASFQRNHPGVLFRVKETGSREVERDVASGHLELGVVTLPIDPHLATEFEVTFLFKDHIVLVAAANHPFTTQGHIGPHHLDGEDLVGFESPSAIRDLIDHALIKTHAKMRVVMELRSIPAILRMVETTGMLAFVSQLSLKGVPSVREVHVRGLKITRRLAVIRHRGRPLSPAATAFAKCLQKV